jgi:hypothetical protein
MSSETKYDHDRIAAEREAETTTIGGLVYRRAKKNRKVTREIRKLDTAQERMREELAQAEEAGDKAKVAKLRDELDDSAYHLVALLLIEDREGGRAPATSHLEEHVDQLDDLGPLTAWALGNDPDPTPQTENPETQSTSS